MSTVARVTTWASGQTLNAADLNGEFNVLFNWVNNTDAGTNLWNNVKISSSASNPLDCTSSATSSEISTNVTGTNGTPIHSFKRSGTTYFTIGVDGADSNKFKIGTSTLTTANALIINQSTSATTIRGTNTNDNASAGFVGEIIRSQLTSNVNGVNNTFVNFTSISLTAGDWDVASNIRLNMNGATVTTAQSVISIYSGNTATDHVGGDNLCITTYAFGTIDDVCQSVAAYQISLASTTTVYLKFRFNFSAGTPQAFAGRISARRVR